MTTRTKAVWEKYIDMSIGILMLSGVLFVLTSALKSCSREINRDRELCEKYSKTIEEYDNCIAIRKKVDR